MKKLVISLGIMVMAGCAGIQPEPEAPTIQDTLGLMVAVYIDFKHNPEEVNRIADTVIAMAEQSQDFGAIEVYLVKEYLSSDMPVTTKYLMSRYMGSIIQSIRDSAVLWPDSQVYAYIIGLAKEAKTIASLYGGNQ